MREVSIELLLAKNVTDVHICRKTKLNQHSYHWTEGIGTSSIVRRRVQSPKKHSSRLTYTCCTTITRDWSVGNSHILCLPVFLYMMITAMVELGITAVKAASHKASNKGRRPVSETCFRRALVTSLM